MEINIDGTGAAIDPKDPKDPEETVQGGDRRREEASLFGRGWGGCSY